jgi:hypothetical protein
MKLNFLKWSTQRLREALSAGCYIDRPVLNAVQLEDWCRANHIAIDLIPASELHCTVLYSTKDVRYHRAFTLDSSRVSISPVSFAPRLRTLGEKGQVVLMFDSNYLHQRWLQFLDLGDVTSYPTYVPHVTLANREVGQGWEYTLVKPPTFPLLLGPERVTDLH